MSAIFQCLVLRSVLNYYSGSRSDEIQSRAGKPRPYRVCKLITVSHLSAYRYITDLIYYTMYQLYQYYCQVELFSPPRQLALLYSQPIYKND
jgi:hypothetical protein